MSANNAGSSTGSTGNSHAGGRRSSAASLSSASQPPASSPSLLSSTTLGTPVATPAGTPGSTVAPNNKRSTLPSAASTQPGPPAPPVLTMAAVAAKAAAIPAPAPSLSHASYTRPARQGSLDRAHHQAASTSPQLSQPRQRKSTASISNVAAAHATASSPATSSGGGGGGKPRRSSASMASSTGHESVSGGGGGGGRRSTGNRQNADASAASGGGASGRSTQSLHTPASPTQSPQIDDFVMPQQRSNNSTKVGIALDVVKNDGKKEAGVKEGGNAPPPTSATRPDSLPPKPEPAVLPKAPAGEAHHPLTQEKVSPAINADLSTAAVSPVQHQQQGSVSSLNGGARIREPSVSSSGAAIGATTVHSLAPRYKKQHANNVSVDMPGGASSSAAQNSAGSTGLGANSDANAPPLGSAAVTSGAATSGTKNLPNGPSTTSAFGSGTTNAAPTASTAVSSATPADAAASTLPTSARDIGTGAGSSARASLGGINNAAEAGSSALSSSYTSAHASPSNKSIPLAPPGGAGNGASLLSQQSGSAAAVAAAAAATVQAQAALLALQQAQQQHAGHTHGHGYQYGQAAQQQPQAQHAGGQSHHYQQHSSSHHHHHQQQQHHHHHQQQHHHSGHHHHHQQQQHHHHHPVAQHHQHGGGGMHSQHGSIASASASGVGGQGLGGTGTGTGTGEQDASTTASTTSISGSIPGSSAGAGAGVPMSSAATTTTTPAPSTVPSTPVQPHPSTPLITGTYAYERLTTELTSAIIAFLTPILPTEEEYRIKEATRRQLERLACRVSPGAKLLAFGSMANGFALRNSDMDLCCLLNKKEGQTEERSASVLVEILGQLIREETDFNVMMLPKARIPIIKISRVPSADLPYEISCDIGFENRLALENTRLLLSYAMVDPPRLRTLVLFLKVWTKRRKLNSPFTGTLSSYGYTLLVLFFLCHVKRPPILPNLQRIPPSRTLTNEEVELNGHNIYFYDDIATLRQEWASQNTENVGELLIDFFRYFSKEFSYSRDVISLRTEGGLMSKDKDWTSELCIEDPFQLGYNVSRTVTKDGLYTIRGEFMRATRILLGGRHQRMSNLIAELCEEREDIISRAPDTPVKRHPSLGPHPRGAAGGPGGAAGGGVGVGGSGGGAGSLGVGFGYHHATAGTLAATAGLMTSPPASSSTSTSTSAAAAAAAAAAVAASGSGTHAAGLIDPRILREYREFYETPRRYDSSYASGLGGSFAFEEMARGLGLGQQGYRSVPAYPPTTAMLAPLSQNNGLAQRLVVGSAYRGSSVSAGSGGGTGADGGGPGPAAAAAGPSRKAGSPGHRVGAGHEGDDTSGSSPAERSGAPSPSGKGAEGVAGAGVGIGISGVGEPQGYPVDAAFINALNRSKSLPRPFLDDRRSSTPMRSEPASPKLGSSGSQRGPGRDHGPSSTFHALQPAVPVIAVGGTVPRPPGPQRHMSSTGVTKHAASAQGEPPSPVFGGGAGPADAVGEGGATSTPMSMSASAGPARYLGAGVGAGPHSGQMAWPYAHTSSAALAAAYAQAAAAAAAAGGYPVSAAAAYSYAAASAAPGGVANAAVSGPGTSVAAAGAGAPVLSSYAVHPHASPIQYAQGFGYDLSHAQPVPGQAPYHHAGAEHLLDPRSGSFALDSSVSSSGMGPGEDVFGTISGAPMIPGMSYGSAVSGPGGIATDAGRSADDMSDMDDSDERRGQRGMANEDDDDDDADRADSDISEGVLDELARVSEMEAKEGEISPAFERPAILDRTTAAARPEASTTRSGKAVGDVEVPPSSSSAIDIKSPAAAGNRTEPAS